MHARRTAITNHCRIKQRGAALLIMLVIMVMGAATFLVSSLSRPGAQIERDIKTIEALAQAKEALIAYAASNDVRAGDLPCPDTDAPPPPGTVDNNYGAAEGTCAAGAIGRLPWKTLGISELVDESGEPLWYAISGNFRLRSIVNVGSACTSNPSNPSCIINSDTSGTLDVYDNDGTTLLTPAGSKAVAVVFAPGKIIGSKQRSSVSDKTTASNYLDNGPSTSNNPNNAAGPFIAANQSDTFNDRLLYITADQLLQPVEKRVAGELKNLLKTYYSSWGAYPFAALFDNPLTASFTGSASNYNGLPPYGGLNGIGIEPTLPTWNASPTISFTGGVFTGSMGCILSNDVGGGNFSRWRCCDVSGGSCTGNNITIPAGVTVTITGRLKNVGLGFWKLHDITDTNQVRARNSSGSTVLVSSLLNNVSVTSTQNYTDGSATVVFSGTGKPVDPINLPNGSRLQRIELRDIQYQSSPLPDWFQINDWHKLIYYATSTNYAFGGNKSCAPACLTVNSNSGANTNNPAVVVTTGKALSSQAPHYSNTLSNYLEGENATPADFIYENKTRSSTFNDQVIVVAP